MPTQQETGYDRATEIPRSSNPQDLADPNAVLLVLEADQLVAAKQTRFGVRKLSLGSRALLWSLRLYVVVMVIIVLISVFRAMHSLP